jgi:S1-C subfamily serine protease
MSTPRFIRKTELSGLTPLRVRDRAVLDQGEALRTWLRERAGAQAADLFAEPVVTWGNDAVPGSVSWYAPVAGDPVSLADLDQASRAGPEALLRDRLRQIEPLLDDPEWGLVLRHALLIPDLRDVLSAGDDVVITNWGLIPVAAARDPRGRTEQFRQTFGRYAPFTERTQRPNFFSEIERPAATAAAPPAAQPPRPAAAAVPPRPATASAAAAAGRAATPPTPPIPPTPPQPPPRRGGGLVPILSFFIVALVAIAALALGFWLGWNALLDEVRQARRNAFDPQQLEVSIRSQQQVNEELRRRIAATRELLNRDLCTIENPLGLPATPQQTPATAPRAAGQPAYQGSLADLLDQAVVLVVTKQGNDIGFGTGFFVTPDTIVTNRHVVESADADSVWVTNRLMGSARRAGIAAMTPGPVQIGRPDFALLRIEAVPQAPLLPISTNVERLSSVVAAGFPGIVTQADTAFTRLIQQGDISAVPQTVLTSGEVSSIQADQMSQRVTHTAAIAQGNSGGPLVDRCGRIIGVNSFRLPDRQMLASAFYALGPETLLAFLRGNGINPTPTADPCQPPSISITAPPLQMPQPGPQAPQRPATPPAAQTPAQPPATQTPGQTPAQTPAQPATQPPRPTPAPQSGSAPPASGTPPTAPAAQPAAPAAAPAVPATPPPPAASPPAAPASTPPASPPAATSPAAPPAAQPAPAAPAAPRN